MNRWGVFRGVDDLWYWHLVAANDEVLATSEGYTTKEHAQEGVQAAMRDAGDAAEVVEE